jgi:hypothetical protein
VIALDHVSVRAAPPGLRVTGHRVLLDRSYLEVGREGEPLVFLRPDDIHAAARALGRAARPYRGRDGEWLDVDLAGPVLLTRRIDRGDWPPARPGAGRIEQVRVRGDAAALLDPLEALGGPPPELAVDHAPGEPLRVTGVLAAGVRVL